MKTRVLLSHRARRLFFFIHLWMGLILGAWFALIGITGSVLAWRGELNAVEVRWRFPVEYSADKSEAIPLSQALAALKKSRPDLHDGELTAVTVPNSESAHYAFTLGQNRRTARTVLVDPYTARVHPPFSSSELTVRNIQQIHQRLLAGPKGYVFNGFLNVLAIPLLLSGLWLWWPTKWKHLKAHLTIKRGASLKRRLYDLHNVMGIYLYVVLFITTLTGAMLVQQHITADGGIANFLAEGQEPARGSQPQRGNENRRGNEQRGGNQQRGRTGPVKPTVVPQGNRLSDDEILAAARQAHPGLELTRLQLPQRADEPIQATYARAIGFELSESAFINPYAGQLVETPPSNSPGADPARRMTRALHFGEFGGVLSKLIYTITGLLPLGLFVTGFWMWLKKKPKHSSAEARAR